MLEYDRVDISEKLMLTKQMHQKSVVFVIIGCHSLIQKLFNFKDVAIVSVKGSDCRTHFWYMEKNDAIYLMKNSNLNENYSFIHFI